MRRFPLRQPALALLALLIVSGAALEARAQYSRRSPIVEAVQKARGSVVTIVIPKTQYQTRDTVGTGVVIDERGYIVTNRHVVGSRPVVTVRLSDGKELAGKVLLASPNHDLALVHVNAGIKLKALTLAPVTDLMVGETVIAIGHPYGYSNTVSVGIISALNRTITMPTGEVLTGLIQTDASINPGNSGGPLLNINGELIGINNAIRDGAQGIAFAINAGTVRDLLATKLSALKLAGVGHGMQCCEKVVAETGDRQFVVVAAVYQDTPAAVAGLRQGDEILTIGERRVVNNFDLERFLWDKRPGQQVQLKVRRQGREISVTLTLANGRTMKQTAQIDFSKEPEPVQTTAAPEQPKTDKKSRPPEQSTVMTTGHQQTTTAPVPSADPKQAPAHPATTKPASSAKSTPKSQDGTAATHAATSSPTANGSQPSEVQRPVFAFVTEHYALSRRETFELTSADHDKSED
jgi:serine protease Do